MLYSTRGIARCGRMTPKWTWALRRPTAAEAATSVTLGHGLRGTPTAWVSAHLGKPASAGDP